MDTPAERDEHASLLDNDALASEEGHYSATPTPSQRAKRGKRGLNTRSVAKALRPLYNDTLWAKTKYYIPFFEWLPNYSTSLLAGDVLAGLTIASMLIPQSVSYASSLAKLSPLAGLFSASIPAIIYALMGTSRQLNVAPEAALSLLVGQAVSAALFSDPHDYPDNPDAIRIAVTTIITFQVGLFSFLLGFFRLGFIDVILSRALLRGFITAIAIVIMIEQLIPMFGLTPYEHELNPESTLDKFLFLVEHVWDHAHPLTAIISFGTLGVLIGIRLIKGLFTKYWYIYRIPEVLVVVIASTILCNVFKWDDDGIEVLGSVPIKTGDSFVKFPLDRLNMRFLTSTTSTAILVAVVGYLDSIVAAKQNAMRFSHSISPNRELVALGAANIVASFVPGTLPAYGSITRSRIVGEVGGRSQMAALVCSTTILLTTFFLLPSLYYLPKCVLAAVIGLVVYSILAEAPHDILFFWKMRAWIDLALMGLTFICTLVWNVEVGIVVSLIVSLVLVVRKSSKPRMTILGRIPGTMTWEPISDNPEAEEDVPGVLIIRIRESLDFANTAQLKERLRRLELYGVHPSHPSELPRRPQAEVLVFHMADVDSLDASAVQLFLELIETYHSRGVRIFFTHLQAGPRHMFDKAGIIKLLGNDAFYENVAQAMLRIEMIESSVTN